MYARVRTCMHMHAMYVYVYANMHAHTHKRAHAHLPDTHTQPGFLLMHTLLQFSCPQAWAWASWPTYRTD